MKNHSKFCDVGRHSVPVLFHARKKDRPSCCKSCYRPKVGDVINIKQKDINGDEYRSDVRIVNVTKTTHKEKGVAELLKLAEIVFNKWIRNRDRMEGFKDYFICISCDKIKPIEDADCGHFFPKTYSAVRFDEDNTNAECVPCNRSDPNHLIGYERNLKIKIGLERFKMLEEKKNTQVKWNREELLYIINHYKI